MASPSETLKTELNSLAAAYVRALENASKAQDEAPSITAKVVLTSYHAARDGIAAAFSEFEYPKDVHREFLRSVLRFDALNPAFLGLGRDQDFASFSVIVKGLLPELRSSMAGELHEYARLLEETPREYLMAAVGGE